MSEQQRWKHVGNIKVYQDDRVIQTHSFQSKRQLREIIRTYQGLQVSVIFNEQKGITDDEKWWNNIKSRITL